MNNPALNLPRLKDFILLPIDKVDLKLFDCGDDELNNFFWNDAKDNEKELLSKTYFLVKENTNQPLVGFSIANAHIDAIMEIDITISPEQRFKTYPAVRIGKFAAHKDYKRQGLGEKTMLLIKTWFTGINKTGCRFIIVDSRKTDEAEKFYNACKFEDYPIQDTNKKTKLKYFDLIAFKTAVSDSE